MKTAKLIIYIFICFFSTTAIAQFTFYRDMDGDGLGGSQYITSSYPPPGYVANNDDCNDSNSNIGRATTWYRDADGDGLGDPNVSSVSCTQPNGYVSNDNDVDDGDGDVTDIPPTVFYRDVDGDSWGSGFTINSSYPPPGYTSRGGDCNDGDGSIYPGAPEFCDGKDNDCNGQTDDGAVEVPNPPGVTNNCGNTVLTKPSYTGGVTLYWQSSASGTSTSNSSNTIVLTSGTVYYIRAKANNATGCWSNARTINYTVNPSIGTSGGSNKSRCGSGTVTLTASLGSNANQIRWYTSASGGSPIHTGTSFTTPSLSTTTPYYAESRNTSTGCVASSRRYMQAVINPVPGIASGNNKSRCGNGTVALTASPGSNANQVRWYTSAAGGSAIHTGASFTTPNLSTTTSYYAESYNSATTCVASSRRLIQAIINPPVSEAGGNNVSRCGNGTVTLNATVGSNGNTIRWFSASSGGTLLHTGTSFITPSLSATTTYYAESYNSSTQCSASSRKAIQAQISSTATYYADTDNDGLGDPANSLIQCDQPPGYVQNASDSCPSLYDPTNACIPQSGDPETHNYIYARTYQTARSIVPTLKFQEDDGYVQSISYFDGLGRPKQQIGIRHAPDSLDIVTHIGYDDYGRQEKEWLPIYRPNEPLGNFRIGDIEADTRSYYKLNYASDFPTVTGLGVNAYSQKEFEPSPLNRVFKQAAPGEDWKQGNGHEIEFDYFSNAVADNVAQFEVTLVFANNTYTPTLVKNGTYGVGELYKNVTRDENHSAGNDHTIEEFTDKQGRIVLKRTYNGGAEHDTYYIYDDYGNLTYVLPPKMDGSSAAIATINANLAELGYQYTYDDRNRLVEKQIPGKYPEYIIYNKLDQPIMTQDAVQRAANEWLFTKYDAFGRVAYTGKATSPAGTTRTEVQDQVDALPNPLWVEKQSTNRDSEFLETVDIFYDNGAYPNETTLNPMATLTEVLTINYYDDYVDVPTGAPGSVVVWGSSPQENNTTNVQGLPTVNKVKVLGTNNWINTLTYYDDKARPIYTYSENEYLGTVDIVESNLDFAGKPLQVRTGHTRNATTIVTLDNFSYDHVGRLLSQTQCIGNGSLGYDCNGTIVEPNLVLQGSTVTTDQIAPNSITITPVTTVSGDVALQINPSLGGSGGPEELIVYNDYDELGQLVQKKVGGAPGTTYANTTGLQTVDYTYNVRGWLKSINQDVNDDNDLFNFGINYNTAAHGGIPLFNGNISETEWETANDNTARWYHYGYDALNRITGATGSSSNYNLGLVQYDKNGNIERLTRNGHRDINVTSFGLMDDLTYSYTGNQLQAVDDANPSSSATGFVDGMELQTEYTYDGNGNMITDANKGITGISYNYLNLPTSISINGNGNNGTIDYIYDATGTKLKKTAEGSMTEYAGNYVYSGGGVNTTLQFFAHPEGYVAPDGQGGYTYVYQYKDHLGNIRLSYADGDGDGTIIVTANPSTTEMIEENNYYPFGLKHKGYNGGVSPLGNSAAQKWKYQGQEFTDELGLNAYEFKYRMHDPAIGRFWQVDPLTEDYMDWGPYVFSGNRVVDARELEGLEPWLVTKRSDVLFKGDRKAATQASKDIVRMGLDEIPGAGEVASIAEGDISGAIIGLVPFGKLGRKAFKGLRNLFKKSDDLPVLEFSKTETPNISENIQKAMEDGAPDVLTKEGSKSKIRANRREALKDKEALRNEGQSLDEFPFASTKEGGSGARVQSVPTKEQSVQGGKMSQFFQKNDIKEGDKFKVKIKK